MKIKDVILQVTRNKNIALEADAVLELKKTQPSFRSQKTKIRTLQGVQGKYLSFISVGVDDFKKDEDILRNVFLRALKRANAQGVKTFVISVLDEARDLPLRAVAKIMAQEIFRFIREEKTVFKRIVFVLGNKKIWQVFKKTVLSYLDHILHKISQGPLVTVDAIIEVKAGVVLVKRSNPPFGWAIPGGFVDYGESLEKAARREAKEETGLIVHNLKQMHTYSNPSRDPRFHTVSTVFTCQAKGTPQGASDALEAKIFKPHEWQKLKIAFDHRKVLKDYLKKKE